MDEKELPSSSDESDEDFVPKEEEIDSCSGSEEVSDCGSSGGEDKGKKCRKRKSDGKKRRKKLKANENEEEVENEEENEEDKKNKIDVDALWADFQKDVNAKEVKKNSSNVKWEVKTLNESNSSNQVSEPKISVTSKLNKVVPSFSNRNKVGGLSRIMNQIGKKDKMSTLQKSQLDWNNFKKREGIEEEIKLHNRGKDGYLEKQDFLQRTDLRQFEIEKDLRSTRRKF